MEYLTEKYIEPDVAMQYETNIVDDGWLFKHTEKKEIEKLILDHFETVLKSSCFVNETGIDKLSPISMIIIDDKTDHVIGHCSINPKMNATTGYKTPFSMKTSLLINNGILRGIVSIYGYFFQDNCNWKVWKTHTRTAKIFPYHDSMTECVFENVDHIHLGSMAIHPNYQRMGFGTILLQEAIDHIDKYYNNENANENENEKKKKDKIVITLGSLTPKSKNFYSKCGFSTLFHVDFYADTINRKVNIWTMMYDYNNNSLKKQHKDDYNDNDNNNDENNKIAYFKNQMVKEYQRAELADKRKTFVVGALLTIVGAVLLRRLSLRFYQ